jgi:hypothetical protein
MRFRKLRIAWSVVWGIIAVLLCVLWMRSYTMYDQLDGNNFGDWQFTYASQNGRQLLTGINQSFPVKSQYPWFHLRCMPADLRGGFGTWGLDWQIKAPYPASYQVNCPHWFLVMDAALLALLPWVRHLRWRFSLRTLLIATTLVALVLEVVLYLSR